jgi:lipopolysaccharide/colanic/teichoic acid biosynthesis glycosyltransferase
MPAPQTSTGAGGLSSLTASPARPFGASLSPWCFSVGKRVFDFAVALLLLLIAWPIILLVGLAIRLSSPGAVLFRQKRVGKDGRLFELVKFRSMRIAPERSGPGITREGDSRIFPVGRLLRNWKLDELPQLINVLRGEMSLVGPRPDLPEFCATLAGNQRQVLALKPGITGAATVVYRHEEQLLASQSAAGVSGFYVEHIYPEKVRLDLDYAHRASFFGDLRILLQTLGAVVSSAESSPHEQVSRQ